MKTKLTKRGCGHPYSGGKDDCKCHICPECDFFVPGGWSKKTDIFDGYYEELQPLYRHQREAHPLSERVNSQIWRWLYAPPAYRVLHRLIVMKWNSDDDPESDYAGRCCTGEAACGYATKGDGNRILPGMFFIPGMFSRMGLSRCKKCCVKVGVPFGDGTPWNDKTLSEEMKQR